jgi:predicted S18 family serine protease
MNTIDQEHVDMIFRKPVFYGEMSAPENKIYTALVQVVNMLKMVKNKQQDTKLHTNPKDVQALLTEIKNSLDHDQEKADKAVVINLINKICDKFGIPKVTKNDISSLIKYIKDEAEKIEFDVEPFLRKSEQYVDIIKSNSV